jgi:hypothetical protein
VREAIGDAFAALHALPFVGHRPERINVIAVAAGTADALGPTPSDQIPLAGIFVGEHALELGAGQLVDRLRLLTGHDGSPYQRRPIWH